MRNTLQEQYNLIKEGKGNKQQFFKSVRHLFPDLVTPINTYDDTVRILKNRGIITEGIGGVVTKGKTPDWHAIFKENITEAAKEAKAEEKETTKEVTDMATRGYDYKDEKNYDNVFGEEFLKGYYTEMKDPKNEGKHVEELRQIVAKNLAKDINHYVKNGQFGIKGVGYTTDAPGLGEPKPAKGKHKSSGYGDLKESVLRSQIYLLVKEVLAEEKNKDLSKHRLGVLKAALATAEKEIKIVDKDSKAYKEFEKTIAGKKAEIKALEKESLTENYDVLDHHLSVIQANGYTKDEAYSYLEDQVGDLTQEQIDTIINNAFPMRENKKSESEIIDALRKKYKFDLKGVNDDEDYKNLPYQAKLKVKDYIRFDINQEH